MSSHSVRDPLPVAALGSPCGRPKVGRGLGSGSELQCPGGCLHAAVDSEPDSRTRPSKVIILWCDGSNGGSSTSVKRQAELPESHFSTGTATSQQWRLHGQRDPSQYRHIPARLLVGWAPINSNRRLVGSWSPPRQIQHHHVRTLLEAFEDDFTSVGRTIEVPNVEVRSKVGQLAFETSLQVDKVEVLVMQLPSQECKLPPVRE